MKPNKSYTRHFHNREEFLRFVREISPTADPTSVLLFGQIHRAGNMLIQIAEKRLEATGLTWPKFRLLIMLLHGEREGQVEGVMPSELSERQNISRNTASALIGSLEADGYISRELHETDRRKFLIRLTPKGRRILHAQMDNHFRYIGECFGDLSAKEREQLYDLLTRLDAGLSAQTARET